MRKKSSTTLTVMMPAAVVFHLCLCQLQSVCAHIHTQVSLIVLILCSLLFIVMGYVFQFGETTHKRKHYYCYYKVSEKRFINVCAAQFSTNTVKCTVTISAKWSVEQWSRNKKKTPVVFPSSTRNPKEAKVCEPDNFG